MQVRIKRIVKLAALVFACFFAFIALVAYTIIGTDSTSPDPPPPKEAKDIHFFSHSGLQSWEYLYRFDAPDEISEAFAMGLMRKQSKHGEKCLIKRGPFIDFPITTRFPAWFDVSSIQGGKLITGDNWIFAVIDTNRHRLYYYNSR